MDFSDGILQIYQIRNLAAPGEKPNPGLMHQSDHYFCFETIGVHRYYAAKQANEKIESVVCIWRDQEITSEHICRLEDKQYKIQMVQHGFDEQGLAITRLTLGRLKENYEYSEN